MKMKRTENEKDVYIVYDYDGMIVADDVEGEERAKEIASQVFGSYEKQY